MNIDRELKCATEVIANKISTTPTKLFAAHFLMQILPQYIKELEEENGQMETSQQWMAEQEREREKKI